MNIDKDKLKLGLWYEDKDGNRIQHDPDQVDPPENAVTYKVCFPLEIIEKTYKLLKDEDGKFNGKTKELFSFSTHIGSGNSDVILGMVNSGDYTLPEALVVYANACERCMNVLAHRYANDGYEEFSEEWLNCNTVCDYCRDLKYES